MTNERLHRELDAAVRALPATFKGQRWGVFNRNSSIPDTPRAVFTYQDDAYAFAIATYGKFDEHTFRFKMPPGIEVVPVGGPAVVEMSDD